MSCWTRSADGRVWYLGSNNIVCFSKSELFRLIEASKKPELLGEVHRQGLSLEELRNNHAKMEEITDVVSKKTAEHRDEHEVLMALFDTINFYGKESRICFEMQSNFNPGKDAIANLQDLNCLRRGDAASDFMIQSKDGFRAFQMKRYRGKLLTRELLDFIFARVESYGNNLGDTNLLIVLQSTDGDVSPVDFEEIYKKLKQRNLKFGGWITIAYNENNRFSVMNHVYPELATTQIPWQSATSRIERENAGK